MHVASLSRGVVLTLGLAVSFTPGITPTACAEQVQVTSDLLLEVEYVAGDRTGELTSYLVIDFEAAGGDTFAFGYQYDGAPTAETMVRDILAAGSLEADLGVFEGFGAFVNNWFHEGQQGDVTQFWRYELGMINNPGNDVEWATASEGMSTRTLTDGSFDGWYNSFADASAKPRLPVPEPASAAIILLGSVLVTCRRR